MHFLWNNIISILVNKMKKYRYNIVNLDCANCARKIEEELNKEDFLKDVVINFGASSISYVADGDVLDRINSLIKKIEPGVYVCSDDEKGFKEYYVSILVISVLLGILGVCLSLPGNLEFVFIIVSYILLLYRPFINALKMLISSRTINENALITISCVGAFLVGEVMEGMVVVALYTLGKILEEKAINNTRNSIKGLLEIKQDYANLKSGSDIKRIDVSDICIDDILVVKKGEKVPVDGVLYKGNATFDMSSLTGESNFYEIKCGEEVLSGSVNVGDVIEIKATHLFSDSTVSRILELTLNASSKKANMETIVSKFSKVYTPIVLILAILVALILPIFGISFSDSIYRGLIFLVIACPCAIAISVPLSYFTGIGVASKNGILVKGSNYLDNLVHLKRIIFDKTGTLTSGFYEVVDIEILDDSYSKNEIISILAHGEVLSNHPIAKSIVKLYEGDVNSDLVSNYKEISGKGISYKYDGRSVRIGSCSICKSCNIETDIHVNIDGVHVASIILDDGIKSSAYDVVSKLNKFGISTLMFTGDKKEEALEVSKKLGINDVKYEMLPDEKYYEYERITDDGLLTAFVGDGINDAPVIKRSDIGIAMGAIGSASSLDAADIVIMNDDLMKISEGIDISKYTNYIIKQNLIFAIGVKVIILLLSVVGIASMWFAVFADTGVTLLTVLNTIRIRNKFK